MSCLGLLGMGFQLDIHMLMEKPKEDCHLNSRTAIKYFLGHECNRMATSLTGAVILSE